MSRDAYLVAGFIVAVLSLASVAGWLLKLKYGARAAIDNLNSRIKAWWAMTAVIGLALLGGRAGVIVLFAFASFAALREYATLVPTRRSDHWVLLVGFFVVLPFQYFLVWMQWYGLYSIFIPVYGFLVLPMIAVLREDTRNFMQRTATIQWGLMLCVFCISHIPALLNLDIPGFEDRNAFLLVFLILIVQLSDVLQYVWGKLLGRVPIAPRVSPSKTVAGLLGGLLSTTLLGAVLSWMTPFTPLQAALIALGVNIAGFLGGLVMSAIKRDRGVKDWGTMIEGHGGMLDRLDSLCFSAPIFFHVVRYWWT
jgi:phosphatidate cytidylyltransferase